MALPITLKRRLTDWLPRYTQRATAALPASTTGAIFTITGGKVELIGIVGEVTTAIQAQATTLKLRAVPTTGVAADVCATGDVNGVAIGGTFGITGVPADALNIAATATNPQFGQRTPVLPIGSLSLVTVVTSTGSVKWTAVWRPIDRGASLVAA